MVGMKRLWIEEIYTIEINSYSQQNEMYFSTIFGQNLHKLFTLFL